MKPLPWEVIIAEDGLAAKPGSASVIAQPGLRSSKAILWTASRKGSYVSCWRAEL